MKAILLTVLFLTFRANAETTNFERVKEKYSTATQSAELGDFPENTVWSGKCYQGKAPNERVDSNLVVLIDGDPVLGYSTYFDVSGIGYSAVQLYKYLRDIISDLVPAYLSKENNSLVQLKKNVTFKELRKSSSATGTVFFLKATCASTSTCSWQGNSATHTYANGSEMAYCYFYSKEN